MVGQSGTGAAGTGPVEDLYRSLVATGEISEDAAQLGLAVRLDDLDRRLSAQKPDASRSLLGWLFPAPDVSPVTGFYIHGGVGRGKSMLMDAFYDAASLDAKRRAHFHQFMDDVHGRVHAYREARAGGDNSGDDPIAPVATEIAAETRLLCLDEFAVEDIADAMILSRLFDKLFSEGLVLVATSNTRPEDLYLHGLNRPLFVPFIATLKQHVAVVELDTGIDYRLANLGEATAYLSPLGQQARAALDGIWRSLAGGAEGAPSSLTVKGRTVPVPLAAGRVARFAFADLCEAPLGASDFAAIAGAYDSVIIDDIPVIDAERRDVARRFINLVDVFYDNGVKLAVSAAAEPDELYRASSGREAFAFRRTVSRLIEMRSAAYLSAPRQAGDGQIGETGKRLS